MKADEALRRSKLNAPLQAQKELEEAQRHADRVKIAFEADVQKLVERCRSHIADAVERGRTRATFGWHGGHFKDVVNAAFDVLAADNYRLTLVQATGGNDPHVTIFIYWGDATAGERNERFVEIRNPPPAEIPDT